MFQTSHDYFFFCYLKTPTFLQPTFSKQTEISRCTVSKTHLRLTHKLQCIVTLPALSLLYAKQLIVPLGRALNNVLLLPISAVRRFGSIAIKYGGTNGHANANSRRRQRPRRLSLLYFTCVVLFVGKLCKTTLLLQIYANCFYKFLYKTPTHKRVSSFEITV